MTCCKLCNSLIVKIISDRPIRNGGIGNYTTNDVQIYQCQNCKVIWHEDFLEDIDEYYESETYRNSMDGSSSAKVFYEHYDERVLEKFQITGTDGYRGKIVADIGCAAGGFLDFISGVADTVIGIEPSEQFRIALTKKGYPNFAYTTQALERYENKIDFITSFDVIEHVKNPQDFLDEVFSLLNSDGKAIIGTPTDAPIMRELLGESYEKQILFNTQHLWIFNENNLKLLAKKSGFRNIEVKYYQRYGIDNLLGWLLHNKPASEYKSDNITTTLSHIFKGQCEDNKVADYIVLFVTK